MIPSIVLAVISLHCVLSGYAFTYEGRIVGGILAPEHHFPYAAGLRITKSHGNRTYWCGGSLITLNFILTAAHCVHKDVESIEVVLGTNNRYHGSSEGHTFQVPPVNIIIHSKYEPTNFRNDIALLKLPYNVILDDNVQLIQLAPEDMDQDFLEGKNVTAVGWGRNGDNTKHIEDRLRFVDVTIVDTNQCQKYYGPSLVTRNNICIDGSELKGTCKGDSGGPLVYTAVDGGAFLIGLTSYGSVQGCEKGFPTAFTRVTSFLKWISLQIILDI